MITDFSLEEMEVIKAMIELVKDLPTSTESLDSYIPDRNDTEIWDAFKSLEKSVHEIMG